MKVKFEGKMMKQGDGYVLSLPSEIGEYGVFKRGDEVFFFFEDGHLAMRKARPGDSPTSKIR